MSPESLLEQFGYFAVFLGTFLEGEAILVTAGFFAARGYLHVVPVSIVAFAGAYTGHVFWFWLGRAHGVKLLDRFPRMKRHFGKSVRVFERYGPAAIVITQWIYGLRITCAVIIGMSRISLLTFLLYEAVSCAAWAIAITALGYYFGRMIESVLGRVAHIERYGLFIIVAIAVGFWLYHRWKEKREDDDGGELHS
jgi:membrane protein DedA with SNARE-associated domain